MAERTSIESVLARIRELSRADQLEEAASICDELVRENPNVAEAWFEAGVLAMRRGDLSSAEIALRKAVSLDPGKPGYWSNLSVALLGRASAGEVESCARKAVQLNDAGSSLWLNLGYALYDQHKWRDASDAFRKAVDSNPQDATAWGNLGAAEQKLDRLNAAKDAYQRSLALAPGSASALTNYARLLSCRGKSEQAIELLQPVLVQAPHFAAAWIAAGNAHMALGDYPNARQELRRALEISPGHTEARRNLATVLLVDKSLDEAQAVVQEMLADDPQCAEAWELWSAILQKQGQFEEASSAVRHALELAPDPLCHSTLLFHLQYSDDVTPAELLSAHRQWNTAHADSLVPNFPETRSKVRSSEKLRLGLVSADFCQHPAGFFVLPLLECIDKSKCSVICYSDRSIDDDPYTERFRHASDTWRRTVGLSSQEFADQVRSDEIDVLVDLMGHTGSRLRLFALKPARMQLTWMGYVGTTGLSAMDFLLADPLHIHREEERYYTESVLRMPCDYVCYGPPLDAPDVGPLPSQSSGRVTFGCFNNPFKYASRVIDAWAAILNRVPASDIILKYDGLDHPQIQSRFRGHFCDRGVDPKRIQFSGKSSLLELMANYNRVDIALDTQPYSGGLTTCEALWMGVPVITWPGRTFAGRHATSHMTNAGYPQFVAKDLEGYVELAVEWAGRLEELARVRAEMRENVRKSPLCDARQFAKDFMNVLEAAWKAKMLG